MNDIKVGEEIWKPIKGYEGKYEISNKGRVKSLKRATKVGIKNVDSIQRKEKILTPLKLTKGYLGVMLYDNTGKPKCQKIHRLVALHFIPQKNQVNHIDGNKENNSVENLEWCNQTENMQHSYDIGLRDKEKLRENMKQIGKSKKGVEARWRT